MVIPSILGHGFSSGKPRPSSGWALSAPPGPVVELMAFGYTRCRSRRATWVAAWDLDGASTSWTPASIEHAGRSAAPDRGVRAAGRLLPRWPFVGRGAALLRAGDLRVHEDWATAVQSVAPSADVPAGSPTLPPGWPPGSRDPRPSHLEHALAPSAEGQPVNLDARRGIGQGSPSMVGGIRGSPRLVSTTRERAWLPRARRRVCPGQVTVFWKSCSPGPAELAAEPSIPT